MNEQFFAFFNHDFINLFFIPFGTTLVSVACSYAEKHDVFRSLQADEEEQQQAHFESLRTGVDLVLIGVTAVIAVVDQLTKDNLNNALILTMATLIIVQLSLLLGVVFCHLTWRFPEWARGVILPNVLGFVAAGLAIEYFRFALK